MVVAQETKLQELFEGTKQYQVPLYQRPYAWQRPQLKRLWKDLLQLAQDRREDAEATHFIGSVVFTPSPSIGAVGLQQYVVIDGQQRLTTLAILLAAVRDHRSSFEGPENWLFTIEGVVGV